MADGIGYRIPDSYRPLTYLDDPVDANIVEEGTARALITKSVLSAFTPLPGLDISLPSVLDATSAFVPLFDARLHYFEMLKARSPFLFTVLIAAGAKFFALPLYPILHLLATRFATTYDMSYIAVRFTHKSF